MSPGELREAIRGEAFRPFQIRLASGRVFDIPHPEYAWLSPSGRSIAIYSTESDAVSVVDTVLIESLEFSNGHQAGRGEANGRSE